MITQENFNVAWSQAKPIKSFVFRYLNPKEYTPETYYKRMILAAQVQKKGYYEIIDNEGNELSIEKEETTEAGFLREEKRGKFTNRVIYWIDKNYYAKTLDDK